MIKFLILILFFPAVCFSRQITATVSFGQVSNTFAQVSYGLVDEDTLIIPATATNYCFLGNITASAGHFIYVMNNSKITANGTSTYLDITNMQRVKFIFKDPANPVNGYGLVIQNGSYRGAQLGGIIQDCYFFGIDVYNVADYGWFANHSRSYTGAMADINYNNKWDHCRVRRSAGNAWVIGFSAGNLWDGTEFVNCIADSLNVGTVWALEWNFNVKIRGCRATNTGLTETGHTAIAYVRGSADVYQNYFYNFWGDGARFFGISLVSSKASPMGSCRFYNNIVINSRKYSAVEANTQPGDTSYSYIRPVNYYMDNNTVGQFNAVDYYTGGGAGGGGAAFDIYYGFGVTKIRNNIYFNCYRDKGQGISGLNYLWHNGNGGATVDTSNNRYSTDGLSLLSDTITGKPKLQLSGEVLSYITQDFDGQPRSAPYQIGAKNFSAIVYWYLKRK